MKRVILFLVLIFIIGCSVDLESENSINIPEENWVIQGTGNSYERADTIVSDGSTMAYTIFYNDNALLYYNANMRDEGPGIRVANLSSIEASNYYLDYNPISGVGLKQPCLEKQCAQDVLMENILTVQPVKIETGVRLYFEAEGADKVTRIMYLDSMDGLDFNSGESSICETSQDYFTACLPTIIINNSSGLTQARQFKIGFSENNFGYWDQKEGFMIITGADSCGQTKDGLFYANLEDGNWVVKKDANGCAKPLVLQAHGPVLVKMPDGSYKLYYEDRSEEKEHNGAKPLKLVKGDGTFDGWSKPTEVNFYWPDGSELKDFEESGLGDHFIFLPTNQEELQIMYMNLGGFDNMEWRKPSAGLGVAVLKN
jgi:hypothetical protein